MAYSAIYPGSNYMHELNNLQDQISSSLISFPHSPSPIGSGELISGENQIYSLIQAPLFDNSSSILVPPTPDSDTLWPGSSFFVPTANCVLSPVEAPTLSNGAYQVITTGTSREGNQLQQLQSNDSGSLYHVQSLKAADPPINNVARVIIPRAGEHEGEELQTAHDAAVKNWMALRNHRESVSAGMDFREEEDGMYLTCGSTGKQVEDFHPAPNTPHVIHENPLQRVLQNPNSQPHHKQRLRQQQQQGGQLSNSSRNLGPSHKHQGSQLQSGNPQQSHLHRSRNDSVSHQDPSQLYQQNVFQQYGQLQLDMDGERQTRIQSGQGVMEHAHGSMESLSTHATGNFSTQDQKFSSNNTVSEVGSQMKDKAEELQQQQAIEWYQQLLAQLNVTPSPNSPALGQPSESMNSLQGYGLHTVNGVQPPQQANDRISNNGGNYQALKSDGQTSWQPIGSRSGFSPVSQIHNKQFQQKQHNTSGGTLQSWQGQQQVYASHSSHDKGIDGAREELQTQSSTATYLPGMVAGILVPVPHSDPPSGNSGLQQPWVTSTINNHLQSLYLASPTGLSGSQSMTSTSLGSPRGSLGNIGGQMQHDFNYSSEGALPLSDLYMRSGGAHGTQSNERHHISLTQNTTPLGMGSSLTTGRESSSGPISYLVTVPAEQMPTSTDHTYGQTLHADNSLSHAFVFPTYDSTTQGTEPRWSIDESHLTVPIIRQQMTNNEFNQPASVVVNGDQLQVGNYPISQLNALRDQLYGQSTNDPWTPHYTVDHGQGFAGDGEENLSGNGWQYLRGNTPENSGQWIRGIDSGTLGETITGRQVHGNSEEHGLVQNVNENLEWAQGMWPRQEQGGGRVSIVEGGRQGVDGLGRSGSSQNLGVKRRLRTSRPEECQVPGGSHNEPFQFKNGSGGREGGGGEGRGRPSAESVGFHPVKSFVTSPKRAKQGVQLPPGASPFGGRVPGQEETNPDLNAYRGQNRGPFYMQEVREVKPSPNVPDHRRQYPSENALVGGQFSNEYINNRHVEARPRDNWGQSELQTTITTEERNAPLLPRSGEVNQMEANDDLVGLSSSVNLLPIPLGAPLAGSQKFAAAQDLLREVCTAESEGSLVRKDKGWREKKSQSKGRSIEDKSALAMTSRMKECTNGEETSDGRINESDTVILENRPACSEGTDLSCATKQGREKLLRNGVLSSIVSSMESKKAGDQDEKFINGEISHDSEECVTPSRSQQKGRPQLAHLTKDELLARRAAVIGMLLEVKKKYKRYCEQLRSVELSFEQEGGSRTAASYTSAPRLAMSRCFRRLKDAVKEEIQATTQALEECASLASSFGRGLSVDPTGKILQREYLQRHLALENGLAMCQPSEINWFEGQQLHGRVQRGLPERAVSLLRAWMFEHFLHPYPTDDDKVTLARATGLKRSQVSNWFINARVRLWKPMVEQMYEEARKTNEEDMEKLKEEQQIDESEEGALVCMDDDVKPIVMVNDTEARKLQENHLREAIEEEKPKEDRTNSSELDNSSGSILVTGRKSTEGNVEDEKKQEKKEPLIVERRPERH